MSASNISDCRATVAYPRKPITFMCMVQQLEFAVYGAQSVEIAMVCYLFTHNLADTGQLC